MQVQGQENLQNTTVNINLYKKFIFTLTFKLIAILNNRQPSNVFGFGKQGMVQWWECSGISKFQFNQESGRRRTNSWMCYLQIIIFYLKFDHHPLKLAKINSQSLKLPPHWDTLFREALKERFGKGLPPRRAFKPWLRLKTKIVHFATLFKKRDPILWPYFVLFFIQNRNIFQNNIVELDVLE